MIRCRSCSSSGRSSLSRRSGCPIRMIWSSLDFSVSRLDSIRISSSDGSVRFCASSMASSTERPALRSRTRNSPKSFNICGFDLPVASRPTSIMADSRSSRGSSSVFITRATVVWLSRPRNSVCSTVVFPDPIAPVTTTNPAWVSMP